MLARWRSVCVFVCVCMSMCVYLPSHRGDTPSPLPDSMGQESVGGPTYIQREEIIQVRTRGHPRSVCYTHSHTKTGSKPTTQHPLLRPLSLVAFSGFLAPDPTSSPPSVHTPSVCVGLVPGLHPCLLDWISHPLPPALVLS